MEYKTVIRCSGSEFVGVHKSAYKSALNAKKGLKLSKKVHVSMALELDGTEIFRSHGLGMSSAFWSFKQNLRRMKPFNFNFVVQKVIDDLGVDN